MSPRTHPNDEPARPVAAVAKAREVLAEYRGLDIEDMSRVMVDSLRPIIEAEVADRFARTSDWRGRAALMNDLRVSVRTEPDQ